MEQNNEENLQEIMMNILQNRFGFVQFKSEDQEAAINAILQEESENFIINMAAQAGKSLCYQLPGERAIFFKIDKFKSA
jgi:superfamily II DNA helicase RecQ